LFASENRARRHDYAPAVPVVKPQKFDATVFAAALKTEVGKSG